MDEDVKLNVLQAHEKWCGQLLAQSLLTGLVIVCLSSYSCERLGQETQIEKVKADALKAHDEAMKAMWEKMPAPPPPAK